MRRAPGFAGPLLLASAVALVLALASLSLDQERGVGLLRELWAAVQSQEVQGEELREERRRLRQEIRALRGDSLAVETVAREALGMVRPGERVMRWSPEGPPATR